MHDSGIEYLGWFHLEPEPGRWQFRDRELQRYREHHLEILGELGTAPLWASYYQDVGKPHNGYFDRYYQPKRMGDFANYVRTVVERYRGTIAAYDVWNEPWIHAWWAVGYDETKSGREGYLPSENPQRDFVRLMRTAYQNVKALDPNALVLGVNTTTSGPGAQNIGGSDWTAGVVQNGGLEFCDAIAYHQYTVRNSSSPATRFSRGSRPPSVRSAVGSEVSPSRCG
ncbi:MAG: hypothetical protein KatS3mg115_1985 [Candidatus Poribacteria bacterium]|nr:MAG: hypothetical protein KatS3mg115_1985 [Candidatus Poribacteria bacterium]